MVWPWGSRKEPTVSDRICPNLRIAREELCIAQTDVTRPLHRMDLQTALDAIDRVGVFTCPDWSKHNLPSVNDE